MHTQANSFPVTRTDLLKVGVSTTVLLFLVELILAFLHFDEYVETTTHLSLVTACTYILQSACLFAPVYYFAIRKYKLSLADFGCTKVPLKTVTQLVASSFGILLVFNFILVYVMYKFNVEIPGFGEQEEHISLFGTQVVDIAVGVGVLAVAAPLIEEFIFRGFLLKTLLKYMKPWMASLISATLFGLIHFEFQTLAILIFLGLLLNRCYLKSNSLLPGIVFHMINNLLAFALEFWR